MNSMQLAAALITSPSRAFLALKEQPTFWFPLLAVCLSTAAVLVWYYSIVDIDWLKDRILSGRSGSSNMTAQQRDQAAKFMSGGFLMGVSVVSILITIPLLRAVEALYFSLAGNVVNLRCKFQHWLAMASWTALPHLIATAAMAVYLLTSSSNQVSNEELSLLSLNELFFNKSVADKGFTLLSSLTVLHPWSWWLTVVGVRVWSGRSWLFASVFALTPIVLMYGGWALWVFR